AYGGSLRATSLLPIKTVLLTIPRVILEYVRMMVLPIGLSSVHNVELVTSLKSVSFWSSILLIAAAAVMVWKRAPKQVAFAIVWIMVCMLPVLNIGVFTLDLMLQDRYAFLP